MADVEEIATRLAYEFLKMGRYSASTGPVELNSLIIRAAAADEEVNVFTEQFEAFSGLQIQSVGFEQGTDEPAVHVYLTKGSVRAMKALPEAIDEVPVRAHKMGAINVRPDAAGAHTNRGNVFIRGVGFAAEPRVVLHLSEAQVRSAP